MLARVILLACLAAAAVAAPTDVDAPAVAVAAVAAVASTEDNGCVPTCPKKKAAAVANPCNCQKYFECSKSGKATPAICLPWQNFDSTTQTCEFWWTVTCDSVGPPTDTTATAAPVTVAPVTAKPTIPPVVPGCAWEPECPAEGKVNLGVPCADSCEIYVECNNGQWKKESCGYLAWYFDTTLSRCVMWGAVCAA